MPCMTGAGPSVVLERSYMVIGGKDVTRLAAGRLLASAAGSSGRELMPSLP